MTAAAIPTAPAVARSAPRTPNQVHPTWPLTALLVWFPVWWVLGLGSLSYLILAVPMAWQLRRMRPLRLPPAFWLWALFLLFVVLSVGALSFTAPGTLPGSATHRLFGYSLRLADYLAATVVLLWVGNHTEQELPRARVVRQLSVLFLVTVAGGYLGILFPHFSFTSPVEFVLPHSLRSNIFVYSLVHPASAQVQDVLGYASPRPEAPFDYTNTWGGNLAVLMAFFVVGWWVWGSHRKRIAAGVILALAVVPIALSLNRGLWIGVTAMVLYLAIRLAWQGKATALIGLLGLIVAGGAIFVATPLHSVVSDRIAHPHSNTIRAGLSSDALKGAKSSPIIGYGSNRSVLGSENTITAGKTSSCPRCGNASIGSNGQFWLTLFAQGFVGVTLFTLFFLVTFFRSWRDRSAIGTAGTLVVLLSLMFNFVYTGAGTSLVLYMIAIALLWRNRADPHPPWPAGR